MINCLINCYVHASSSPCVFALSSSSRSLRSVERRALCVGDSKIILANWDEQRILGRLYFECITFKIYGVEGSTVEPRYFGLSVLND